MNRSTCALVAVWCFPGIASAGYLVEDAPTWRGEENTSYHHWEDFTAANGYVDGPNFPGNEPFPSGNALLFNFAEGAFISGENNLYGFGGPLNIHTYGYTPSDAQAAHFNVSTMGSEIDYGSAMLVWTDGIEGGDSGALFAAYSINYWEEVDFGQGVGAIVNVSWSFDLSGIEADVREIGLIWASETVHISLDAATMDIAYAAIPAPGALAVLGLAGIARRRRRG